MLSSLKHPGIAAQEFMPHGMCYLWQPGVLGLNLISDGLIALAYFSIPITLFYLVRKRADWPFSWMFVCFGVFIVACGVSHVMEIWTIWHPSYWLSGGIKAFTGLASVGTSVLLVKLVPNIVRIPSPAALAAVNDALHREIDERRRVEESLLRANSTLEARVLQRTAELESVNRTLRMDNDRFAIAADAAGLGFWSRDVAADTLHWDERMFQLYGRPQGEADLPGTFWLDCLHPEDRARSLQASIDARAGLRPLDIEFRVVHPNGEVRHLRAAARVIRDADGRALRMFGVSFDITERRRADEQFHLAIEAAPTGMLMIDRMGKIVLLNAQAERLFGYPRDELLGEPIERLVPQRFRDHHPVLRGSFFADPETRTMGEGRELYGLRKDGSEVPIEIRLNPLRTTEGEFVLGSIVDLSQRREIDRLRSDFVSTVSHELRTPLTSISGSLGLLVAGAMGTLPDKAAEMVRIAYENSGRLARIINDILDFGKLEAGQLVLQIVSVSIAELLQQAVEINAAYAEKYKVRFVLDVGPAHDRVLADPNRLMQVVTNLLSNAAKFSAPGNDVAIRVRAGSTNLRIEVEDSGTGIPLAFQGRVFEKFAQADASPTRRFEGTGLGLSIARRLVEAMGGIIGFKTLVGKGTIFYVELPLTETAPTPAI